MCRRSTNPIQPTNLTIIDSDNGLSPGRRQAIIWTNAGILLIGPLETNFSEIPIAILTVSFRKMCLKVSSGKWQPFCLGLNVLSRQCAVSLLLEASSSHRVNSSPLDKMATISQTMLSDASSWMKSVFILIKISLKFVSKGPIDNNPALG